MSVNRFGRWLKEKAMKEILFIVGIFFVWLLLQIYILPKFGIST